MSPEQARGRLPDARSDLFAVGAILYEMITGRRAFDGPTAADTISAVLHRDPPEATRGSEPVPAGLERIVRRCLEKDPDDRFQTARDLGFALERLSGSSASWVPVPVVSESRRPWTRAGVAAVLAALATGALLWPSRRVASPGRS
jgi:eukaryotic-like serine/threonine-protein kinase